MKKGKLLAAFLLTLAVGCSAEDPGDFEQGPDAGVENPNPGVVPLSLDPIDALTPFDTVKVTGQGPAGGILSIDAVGRRLEPKTINSDGSFCIDVPLVTGTNKIRFEAIDASGAVSESIFKDVTREGEIPDPEGEGTEGRLVSASTNATFLEGNSYSLEGGTVVENMVDGTASQLYIEENTFGATWLAFDMGESVDVEAFRILSDSECHLIEYKMYLSNATDPFATSSDLDGNPAWVLVVEQTDGSADDQFEPGDPEWVFNLSTATARHFAVQLTRSAGSCDDWINDEHKVIDAYVMKRSDGTEPPPAPSADMCVQ